MSSMELVKATVTFKQTDHPPVMPQVFGHAAVIAGVPLERYVQDGDLLAGCQIKAVERYGHDAVFAVMDVNVETEALGSVLNYRKDMYPCIDHYALSASDDFDKLQLPDPYTAGRLPELLKALRILRKNFGDNLLVTGCVVGPLTLATQLLGMEAALYLALDNPDKFVQLLDFSTEVIILSGTAQIQSGAHLPIVFEPSASQAVVPPQFFRELVLPRLKKVLLSFKKAGALANWLHIAGPVSDILQYYEDIGVDIANIDYYVEPSDARGKLPNMCIDGNIRSLYFVQSEPEEIVRESLKLLEFFSPKGGFILSSGCEIPLEAKPKNVLAMVETAKNWR